MQQSAKLPGDEADSPSLDVFKNLLDKDSVDLLELAIAMSRAQCLLKVPLSRHFYMSTENLTAKACSPREMRLVTH